MTARKVGTLALDLLTEVGRLAIDRMDRDRHAAALADLRAVLADNERLRAALDDATAYTACLLAERDKARAAAQVQA